MTGISIFSTVRNLNLSLIKLCLMDDRNLWRHDITAGIQKLPNVWVAHSVHHFTIWFVQYTFHSLVINLKHFTHKHMSASNEQHGIWRTYPITIYLTYSINHKNTLQQIIFRCNAYWNSIPCSRLTYLVYPLQQLLQYDTFSFRIFCYPLSCNIKWKLQTKLILKIPRVLSKTTIITKLCMKLPFYGT
jgi:hypothetical protein